ncbi:MAG: zinc-ribbon domain-containing protein [Lachnospiraceae bacterium]|nr:zinc-ribbon domain-containing protein [Lachnospiraceae bacterium]
MKCPNCNAEIADNSKFCSKCGTKIEAVAKEEAKKPEETVKCIKCGTELKKGAKFCAKCGSSQIPEAKQEPKPAEAKQESKAAEAKPQPKAIPPMPVQPWKSEPQPAPAPEQKKKKFPVLPVAVVLAIAVIGGFLALRGSSDSGKEQADNRPSNASVESSSAESTTAGEITSGETVPATTEQTENSGSKGDPALLDAVDEKVTEARDALQESAYGNAVKLGTEAISQYMEIAKENNLKEEAQSKIQAAFKVVSDAAVTYCSGIEEQSLGNAGFNEVRNTTQPIIKLLDSLKEEGYDIDDTEFMSYQEGVIPRFKDYYIQKINEITEREQWSRDEAWTYAKQAYSIQDNGETLLFDEYDLEDPLQMRFVYCRGWIYRKRCETGLADGSMTQEEAFDYMIEVLQETDYNLLVLDDLIAYGKAAGKDVSKYQGAYDVIIEKVKEEQGLSIVNTGAKNSDTTVDMKKFWYFNDLDGDEKYKVDAYNGTTKATREWIRENIPEYFK